MKNCMRIFSFLVLLPLISGCFSTPYQASNKAFGSYLDNYIATGYFERVIYDDIWLVVFRATNFTAPNDVKKYTLIRAAELAKENGKDYFSMSYSLRLLLSGVKSNKPDLSSSPYIIVGYAYVVFTDTPSSSTISVEEVLKKYDTK